MVKYFIKQYKKAGTDMHPLDRWGQSPLADAKTKIEEIRAKNRIEEIDPTNKYGRIVDMLEHPDGVELTGKNVTMNQDETSPMTPTGRFKSALSHPNASLTSRLGTQ